jgi:outer membrane protein OmpA-like peptidoglycan-associated protein
MRRSVADLLLGTRIVADGPGFGCILANPINVQVAAKVEAFGLALNGVEIPHRIQELRKREAAMQRNTIVVSMSALFLLASVFAFGGDKAEVKGMIMNRTGDTMIVDSGSGTTTVVLTDDTVTKDDKGLFGLDKSHMSSVVLIPGLKVDIDGATDEQGRVVAKTITVDGDDLEASQMIEAGIHPTAQQVAANVRRLEEHSGQLAAHGAELASQRQNIESNEQNISTNQQRIAQNIKDIEEHEQRWAALTQWDVKGEAAVKFGVGSSKISEQDQEALKTLAQTANGLSGYIVEVMGYADSTGSAAMNTKLSEDRAKAVITYLIQQGNVPVRHIVAPGAMGEYGEKAPNETKAGRAENRRVEVKILVNKGMAGS